MWLRIILGALYLAMAAGQLASWRQMPDLLHAYGLRPRLARWTAIALVAGELVAGGWLLLRPSSADVAPVALFAAVAIAWTGFGIYAYPRRHLIRNCGCFGRFLPQPLSWFTLIQDALLLVYAALLIHSVL